MAIIAAMQSASLALMGRKPSQFFGSTERFEQEIVDLANEVAEDIAQYQDWQALQRIGTVTGDGVATEFALPADYGRMMVTGEVQSSVSVFWGYAAFNSLNDLMLAEAQGVAFTPGGWVITGDKLRFYPAPTGNARFPYVSKQWAKSNSGTPQTQFLADDDDFALPERLLKLGLMWRWRESKRLDGSGDQEAFIKAMDEYAAKDRGARTYRYRGRSAFAGTRTAWPRLLGGVT